MSSFFKVSRRGLFGVSALTAVGLASVPCWYDWYVRKNLKSIIQSAISNRTVIHIGDIENRMQQHPYVPRLALQESIISFMNAPSSQLGFLLGGPGCGKSSILHHVLQSQSTRPFTIHMDFKRPLTFDAILDSVYTSLRLYPRLLAVHPLHWLQGNSRRAEVESILRFISEEQIYLQQQQEQQEQLDTTAVADIDAVESTVTVDKAVSSYLDMPKPLVFVAMDHLTLNHFDWTTYNTDSAEQVLLQWIFDTLLPLRSVACSVLAVSGDELSQQAIMNRFKVDPVVRRFRCGDLEPSELQSLQSVIPESTLTDLTALASSIGNRVGRLWEAMEIIQSNQQSNQQFNQQSNQQSQPNLIIKASEKLLEQTQLFLRAELSLDNLQFLSSFAQLNIDNSFSTGTSSSSITPTQTLFLWRILNRVNAEPTGLVAFDQMLVDLQMENSENLLLYFISKDILSLQAPVSVQNQLNQDESSSMDHLQGDSRIKSTIDDQSESSAQLDELRSESISDSHRRFTGNFEESESVPLYIGFSSPLMQSAFHQFSSDPAVLNRFDLADRYESIAEDEDALIQDAKDIVREQEKIQTIQDVFSSNQHKLAEKDRLRFELQIDQLKRSLASQESELIRRSRVIDDLKHELPQRC